MCELTPKISWNTSTEGNGPAPSGMAMCAGMSWPAPGSLICTLCDRMLAMGVLLCGANIAQAPRAVAARDYPRAWRERYGDEFAELLSQERIRLGLVIDVVRGALDAHVTDMRRSRHMKRTLWLG